MVNKAQQQWKAAKSKVAFGVNADALVGICRGSRHQVLTSNEAIQKKRTQGTLKGTEKIRESAKGVMEHLNLGYIQLDLERLLRCDAASIKKMIISISSSEPTQDQLTSLPSAEINRNC